MKKIYKYIIVLFLLVLTIQLKAQRDFYISQNMLHQPFLNPASIGSYGSLNGALLYKKQWVNIEGAPEIQAFNVNMPLNDDDDNYIGLSVLHDKIGVNDNFSLSMSYAYALKVDRNTKLSFGISAKANILQSSLLNVKNLQSTKDLSFSKNLKSHVLPNFRYGMYYYSNKFYIGFVIPELFTNSVLINNDLTTKNEIKFESKELHYYLSGGYKFEYSNDMNVITSTLLKHVSGSPLQIELNVLLELEEKLGVGFSYRSSNEFVTILAYKINDIFKMAYSYDFSFSKLAKYHLGTHEISLIFNLERQNKFSFISAPRF